MDLLNITLNTNTRTNSNPDPDINLLADDINVQLSQYLVSPVVCDIRNEITLEVLKKDLREVCEILKNHDKFKFEALMDLCGVDYLNYGLSEWVTDKATETGFDRAVHDSQDIRKKNAKPGRFAVIYHLLSYALNQRLRLKVYLDNDPPIIDSVIAIWPSANWYEREAFDLYGILFEHHPDLRRILTDYGFIGHPFRKDFPVSGRVEVRYDETQKRVVYEPVDIIPRLLVPKVIREKAENQS